MSRLANLQPCPPARLQVDRRTNLLSPLLLPLPGASQILTYLTVLLLHLSPHVVKWTKTPSPPLCRPTTNLNSDSTNHNLSSPLHLSSLHLSDDEALQQRRSPPPSPLIHLQPPSQPPGRTTKELSSAPSPSQRPHIVLRAKPLSSPLRRLPPSMTGAPTKFKIPPSPPTPLSRSPRGPNQALNGTSSPPTSPTHHHPTMELDTTLVRALPLPQDTHPPLGREDLGRLR